MEESHRRRHAHQGRYLRSAARLAVNHHPVGIPAEVRNILMDPAQCRNQVGHANVDGVFIGRAADFGNVEEAEDVKAVIDRHLHDVMMPRHLRAFVRG